jgi:hypothetical protein
MLKNIPVKINADKSITANFPYKIYQGEINTHKFIIDPSLVINDTSNVVGFIGFKRADNQKSGFVPLKKEQDGTFTYVIKDYWTLNLVGKVWYTIRFSSIDGDNKLEYQLYVGNSSFPVNPLADYILGDDIPPDTATDLQNQIYNLQEQISTNESNIDSKLNKDFNTYPKLDWDTVENSDIVALNRINQDGTVTQYYAEAEDLYNSVNNIKPDEYGNIELTGENINVSSTNNNTIDEELDLKVNISEPVVYYADTTLPIVDPMISIYSAEIAERAVSDGSGNNIENTYATKTELDNNITNLQNYINDNTNSKTELIWSGTLFNVSNGDTITFNRPLKKGNILYCKIASLNMSFIINVGNDLSISSTNTGEISGTYFTYNLAWNVLYNTNSNNEYVSLSISNLKWFNYDYDITNGTLTNITYTYPSSATSILQDTIYLL